MRVVHHAAPVEHARDLPTCFADAVSGDPHDGAHEFVIENPAVVRSSYGAQFGASVVGLEKLYLLAAMRKQSVLHVDPGERGGQLGRASCRERVGQYG